MNSEELVKAATNGKRVRITLADGRECDVCGGTDAGVLIKTDSGIKEMGPAFLDRYWSGEYEEIMNSEDAPVGSRVIIASERETWNPGADKTAIILKTNDVSASMLPRHPAAVIFGTAELSGYRGKLVGPEIHVYDSSDPITVFLHELGHAYWIDRIMNRREDVWNGLRAAGQPRLPGEFDNGEHAFILAYIYMLRGRILSNAYEEILRTMWPVGYEAVREEFAKSLADDKEENDWKVRGQPEILKAIRGVRFDAGPVVVPESCGVIADGWADVGGRAVPVDGNRRVRFDLLRRCAGRVLRGSSLIKAEAAGRFFVDLDGVLVDFMRGVRELGFDAVTDETWRKIAGTPGFWSNLNWTPDGKRLWSKIRKYRPTVLTSIKMSAGKDSAERGKLEWVRKNLGKNVKIVITDRDKSEHARPRDVLIDDDYNGKILSGWRSAGGVGIKHSAAATTIKKLAELGYK